MPHLLEKIKDKVHHHGQHAEETHHSPPVHQHNVDMSFASLYLHNQARNAKNVSSLVYDDQLAKDAADYAQTLADKDKLVSSGFPDSSISRHRVWLDVHIQNQRY